LRAARSFPLADAYRHQRRAHEAPQRKGSPAVSLDETHHEDELPAAERFADDGPTPEQVYAGTEIREIINEISTNLALAADRVRSPRGRSYSTGRSRQETRRNGKHAEGPLWRARHQLAERLGRRSAA